VCVIMTRSRYHPFVEVSKALAAGSVEAWREGLQVPNSERAVFVRPTWAVICPCVTACPSTDRNVTHFGARIGSPCLRHGVHGAPIGARRGVGGASGQGPGRGQGAALRVQHGAHDAGAHPGPDVVRTLYAA
jgi:hypothetical protein